MGISTRYRRIAVYEIIVYLLIQYIYYVYDP